MKKINRLMIIAITTICSCYLILCLCLYAFQDKFLFFPVKLTDSEYEMINNYYGNLFEEITIDSNGNKLSGWLLNKGKDNLIIYYGGNAEEISANILDFKKLKDYTVLFLNYRGYGKNEGKPNQKNLFSDALNSFDYITKKLNIPSNKVVLFGRSLGSGVAVYVASMRNVSKIILTTPYDSITNIAQKHYPIFPVKLLIKNPFNSFIYAKNVTCPALFLIAEHDNIIPLQNSENLAFRWKTKATKIIIKNANHNDIQVYPEYWSSIIDFINTKK